VFFFRQPLDVFDPERPLLWIIALVQQLAMMVGVEF
jgi:hypothetical protein